MKKKLSLRALWLPYCPEDQSPEDYLGVTRHTVSRYRTQLRQLGVDRLLPMEQIRQKIAFRRPSPKYVRVEKDDDYGYPDVSWELRPKMSEAEKVIRATLSRRKVPATRDPDSAACVQGKLFLQMVAVRPRSKCTLPNEPDMVVPALRWLGYPIWMEGGYVILDLDSVERGMCVYRASCGYCGMSIGMLDDRDKPACLHCHFQKEMHRLKRIMT